MGRSDTPDWRESANTLINAINELDAHLEDGHIEFAKDKLAIISFNTGIICGTISRYEKPGADIDKEHISGLQRNLERKKEQIEILESKVSVLLNSNRSIGNKLVQYVEKEEKVKGAGRSTNKLTRLVKGNKKNCITLRLHTS